MAAELLEVHELALSESEIDDFLREVETALLKIRCKHHKFVVEYNRCNLISNEPHSQADYVNPLWCFLFYSDKKYETVVDVINDFVSFNFGFLTEVDFERTKSGAMRAFTNLRFAADILKRKGIISEEKGDNWSAFQLTLIGRKHWLEIESEIASNSVIENIKRQLKKG